jgi:hypothetical protein
MVKELEYIINKYKLNADQRKMPIEIPNMGRDNLAELFAELEYKRGVEVGVQVGLYNEVLCKANPQATIYGVDPWLAYDGYHDYDNQELVDDYYAQTVKRLEKYQNSAIMKTFSMDALLEFQTESIDFVYIDGNHALPAVIEDIVYWSEKVRIGGIIAGHDFRENKRKFTSNHVPYAVPCYTLSYRIRPWFLVGLKAKLPEYIRDPNRSWFWVKQ